MKKNRVRLPLYNNEKQIIIMALNEFRNKLLKQGRYTDPIDELILKINNTFELIIESQFFFYARNGVHSHHIYLCWLNKKERRRIYAR